MPEFDEFEHHSIHVNAAPAVSYREMLESIKREAEATNS